MLLGRWITSKPKAFSPIQTNQSPRGLVCKPTSDVRNFVESTHHCQNHVDNYTFHVTLFQYNHSFMSLSSQKLPKLRLLKWMICSPQDLGLKIQSKALPQIFQAEPCLQYLLLLLNCVGWISEIWSFLISQILKIVFTFMFCPKIHLVDWPHWEIRHGPEMSKSPQEHSRTPPLLWISQPGRFLAKSSSS